MTDSVVAKVERVSHRYGTTVALDDVTIEIPARRMIGVIGPDGVGKSTLLALIAGVRIIQQGRVTVFDGDMADKAHRGAQGARIAYMPQGLGRNLYPTLSCFDNIDFHRRLFGQSQAERRRRIDELFKATSLDPFEDRPAGKLSGSMKQKLSLCCALIHDPDLLILDEPTTGVDPLSRGQFWDLINTIRGRRPQMNVIPGTSFHSSAVHSEKFGIFHQRHDRRRKRKDAQFAHGRPPINSLSWCLSCSCIRNNGSLLFRLARWSAASSTAKTA